MSESDTARAALVERMARAICLMLGDEPDDPGAEEGPDGYVCTSPLWKAYVPTADVAIAIVLEEAARCAEGHKSRGSCLDPRYPAPREIAAAIRAMATASAPKPQSDG